MLEFSKTLGFVDEHILEVIEIGFGEHAQHRALGSVMSDPKLPVLFTIFSTSECDYVLKQSF